ncbi:MAG: HemK family protein methyltransferase [Actinobacteria bacterium]|nr:HemK family protein methyltransferase [Actinomycetota bacterium]
MAKAHEIGALLEIGQRVLEDSTHIFDDHDNAGDARELLASCLDADPDTLDKRVVPPARVREKYLSLIARRAAGEPFPFLTGRIEFYGLDFKVRPGPFVPRPSSELTVERAARRLKRKQRPVVVDLCTGAGPIAIAIADEFPEAEVWGTDIDRSGLKLGRENAKRLGVDNVTLRAGDMYGGLPERLRGSVDVITGHVPYVPPDEIDDLPTEVKEFEPVFTLSDRSGDGLGLMRKAVGEAAGWLKLGGWLLLEVSDDLPPKIRRLVRKAGLDDMGIASDDDGLSVVIEARRSR